MFSKPVKKTKSAPPTSKASEIRSAMWTTDRSGGHSKSFGMTDQSFANRIGIARQPAMMWEPWVNA